MEEIIIPAPAKINLALDIKGLRDDGFHEVEMIMQSISLHDLVTIKKNNKGINLTTTNSHLPDGRDNIAFRAAELILNKTVACGGVAIHIDKRIPVAGGLAGGSTDAAAVLKGINQLYNLNINNKQLKKMAASLGSDVPFCLQGGTALAYGRGEKLKQLPDIKNVQLIIVTPPIKVSTPIIYKLYDEILPEKKIPVNELCKFLKVEDNINWGLNWGNILEIVTENYIKDISVIKNQLIKMGAIFTLMSGSGPSVFGIVEDSKQAQYIKKNWPRRGDFIERAYTIKKGFLELPRS